MEEKRQTERKKVHVTALVRKGRSDGGHMIMQFTSGDLSLGGVFISTEDLSVLELGEDIEVLVDADRTRYYEGKARVVRSARVFSHEGGQIDSGFGLMFLDPDANFTEMLKAQLAS
jgi:hypothetical protein